MPLEYKSQIGLDVIMPVLDEYIVWYSKIVRSYFKAFRSRNRRPAFSRNGLENPTFPRTRKSGAAAFIKG